jgi:hypothetical protein
MIPALAYRLAGLCAVFGGLLRVASGFAPGLLEGRALQGAYLATDVLLLFGLIGIYGFSRRPLGLMGLVGFAVSVIGVLVVRSAGTEVFGAQTYLIGATVWSVGMVALGVAMLLRGVGSRTAAALWILSLLVGIGGTLLPGQRLSFLIASVAFSAGYIAAGWPLIVGSGGGDSS